MPKIADMAGELAVVVDERDRKPLWILTYTAFSQKWIIDPFESDGRSAPERLLATFILYKYKKREGMNKNILFGKEDFSALYYYLYNLLKPDDMPRCFKDSSRTFRCFQNIHVAAPLAEFTETEKEPPLYFIAHWFMCESGKIFPTGQPRTNISFYSRFRLLRHCEIDVSCLSESPENKMRIKTESILTDSIGSRKKEHFVIPKEVY